MVLKFESKQPKFLVNSVAVKTSRPKNTARKYSNLSDVLITIINRQRPTITDKKQTITDKLKNTNNELTNTNNKQNQSVDKGKTIKYKSSNRHSSFIKRHFVPNIG